SELKFGVGTTKVENRTAWGINEAADWGGIGLASDWDDGLWYVDDMSRYFGAFSNHDDARFTSDFLVFDFDAMREALGEFTGHPELARRPDDYGRDDLRTTEKSKSAYMQYDTHWEGRVPVSLSLGLRYEKTDV